MNPPTDQEIRQAVGGDIPAEATARLRVLFEPKKAAPGASSHTCATCGTGTVTDSNGNRVCYACLFRDTPLQGMHVKLAHTRGTPGICDRCGDDTVVGENGKRACFTCGVVDEGFRRKRMERTPMDYYKLVPGEPVRFDALDRPRRKLQPFTPRAASELTPEELAVTTVLVGGSVDGARVWVPEKNPILYIPTKHRDVMGVAAGVTQERYRLRRLYSRGRADGISFYALESMEDDEALARMLEAYGEHKRGA